MKQAHPTAEQGRAPGLHDEQLQRRRQERRINPGKADDEKKAAAAEAG